MTATERSTCPDPDELVEAIERTDARRDRVIAHLATCVACRQVVAELVRASGATARTASATTRADATIGRYILGAAIGAGAMGVVFRARDPMLDRDIAIKIIDGQGLDDDARERLLFEAKALARVSAPGVISCHDAGFADGDLFVAMELVEGANLRDWARSRRPWDACVRAAIEAARGLAAAHRAGVIHRDVKPDNLLMRANGRAAIGDFGLALGDGGDGPYRTRVAGTPRYLAPEVRAGRSATAASDQYAFCLTVLEVITGDITMTATALALPAALRRVLERGLADDPQVRWPSMDALAEQLDHLVRPRRTGLWLGVAAIVVGAGALTGLAVRPTPATIAACPGLDAPETLRWSPLGRARVQATLGDDVRWRRVDEVIEHGFVTYRDLRRAACPTGGTPALRSLQCLDDGLRAADVQLAALVDPGLARYVADQIYSAFRFEACTGPNAAVGPAPPRRAAEPAVAAVRLDLVRAAKLADDAHKIASRDELAELEQRARTIGYAPLTAEVVAELAHARGNLGDRSTALAGFAEAKNLAERSGDDALRAHILVRLAAAAVNWAGERDRASAWVTDAAAIVARIGDPLLEADLAEVQSRIESMRGDAIAASAAIEQSYELRRRVFGGDHPEVARSLLLRGMVAASRGDLEAADRDDRRALAIIERAYGPEHPRAIEVRVTLASVLLLGHHDDEARAAYVAEIARMHRLDSSVHPLLATAQLAICGIDSGLERPSAEHECLQAVTETELAEGPDSPAVGSALYIAAKVYTTSADTEDTARLAKAIPLLRRSIALTVRQGSQSDHVEAEYFLAYCLADRPGTVREVRQLLDDAIPVMRNDPRYADLLAEFKTWYPRWKDVFDNAHPP